MRRTYVMVYIAKNQRDCGTLFSKFHLHPNLPLTLKIHRKKINNDKNVLFILKHDVYSRICVI